MPKKLLLLIASCFLTVFYNAQNDSSVHIVSPHVNPGLRFTENLGQWNSNILFRAQLDGGMLYFEKNCLTFDFYDKKKYRDLHHGAASRGVYNDLKIKCHAYRISFEGCNVPSSVDKLQSGTDYENFYIGNDRNKWKSGAKNFHQVWIRNLYNDVDYEVFTSANGIKYNFHIKPGADAGNIKLRYEGVNDLKLKDGALLVKLQVNGVTEQKPFAYQMISGHIIKVACNYKLTGKVLSFDFPNGYNRDYELVIDPVLVFAAQSGSSADNFGMTATYDSQGNLYSGGTIFGNGYPTTLGAYDLTFNSSQAAYTDVVITKYNSVGNNLLYSTYIGGTETEIVSSLIVDYNNNLCFYGATSSNNFPMALGAYDSTFNGGTSLGFFFNGTSYPSGTDIYIGKFNSGGTALLASTYLGGSDNDGVNHVNHLTLINVGPNAYAYEYTTDSLQFNYGDQYRGEIQVDISNNIYITSSTRSSDFPTVNAFDNSLGGKQDAIVAKLNTGLSQLIYCSYLGGSLNESGNSLIVNVNNEVYVTGGTCSSDFPTTAGVYSQAYNGGKADGYIARINAAGNQIMQATYLGTNNYDQSYFVQTDKYQNIFVYGQSLGNMPVLAAPSSSLYVNNGRHQFITRFNKTLSNINMSTVFGSNTTAVDISPSAFSVDKCNNIYISGWGGNILSNSTPLANMPLKFPTQATTTGYDFYFMGLDSNAAGIRYGSYFGGASSREHVDGGTSRFDPRGMIYQSVCAGCGGNQDFPVTPGAWPKTPGNPNHSTNCNNGVIKLDFQLQMSVSTINTNTMTGCIPCTVTFTNATPGLNPGATYKWYLGNNVTTTNVPNPTITYTAAGVYTVALVVNDNLTCNHKDSSITFITVHPAPSTSILANFSQCTNTVTVSHNTSGNLPQNGVLWNFGDGSASYLSNPTHTYANNGSYTISLTVTDVNGCKDIKTSTVSVFDFKPAANGDTVCFGKSVTINASGGTTYTWSPATFLNNNQVAAPVVTPTMSTIYTVSIDNNSPGYTCSKAFTAEVRVNPTPTTNFNYTVNPCGGGVLFNDKSVDDVTGWNWVLSPSRTSTIQNPYYFYTSGGTFTVTLESYNEFGCKDTSNAVLKIPPPEPVAVSGSTLICKNDKAPLNATGGVSYQWTPTVSLDFPGIANPNASPSTSTEYSVEITTSKIVDGKPCSYMLTAQVDVEVLSKNPIKATANPNLIVVGDKSTLIYIGDPGATVYWMPERSTSPSTGYTVTAKPDRPTTYTVVATKGPCTETTIVHVDAFTEGCLASDVFIPNTFTPNGDENNSVLYVRSVKIDELYFTVYNRWGEKVFETRDKNVGWDGRYKGRDMDVGVYGWYLKAKCVNGEESFMKGNVTLIR